jgi:predicted lipoprotein with Yx(FWY)xxD motif
MIKLIATASIAFCLVAGVAGSAWADGSCKVQATDKKLAGAAMTSFTKKCARDAASACDAQAAAKKLAGAAKTSFVKKCTTDAVGG